MVEMDVREEKMPHVAELDAARAEGIVERRHAARRAAVEQREAIVRLEEIGADAARVAEVEEVERLTCHARDAISG
jgi:hypothetical protein